MGPEHETEPVGVKNVVRIPGPGLFCNYLGEGAASTAGGR